MNLSGPDLPEIQCYVPDGCCMTPCGITLDDWLCQIRMLLPEGPLWNPTLPSRASETTAQPTGAVAIGRMRIGCEQLILGSCCEETAVPCDDDEVAPQLALIDAFSAATYKAVQQLCDMARELDPCHAEATAPRWGERYGLVSDDPCAPKWPDHVIGALICAMNEIKRNVMTYDFLHGLAARFGAKLSIYAAGDMNCGPSGWWTMARDRSECDPPQTCPPNAWPDWAPVRTDLNCEIGLMSLNAVTCPDDIRLPENCNLPPLEKTQPHDPELYAAFKWLLPRILPQPAYWCQYECDPADCIQ